MQAKIACVYSYPSLDEGVACVCDTRVRARLCVGACVGVCVRTGVCVRVCVWVCVVEVSSMPFNLRGRRRKAVRFILLSL